MTMNNPQNNDGTTTIASITQYDAIATVYAINYNVLRIVGGMGALLFIS